MKLRTKMCIPLVTMLAAAVVSTTAVGASERKNDDSDSAMTDTAVKDTGATDTGVAQEVPAPENKPSEPADSSPEAASEAVSTVANHIYAQWRESGYVSQRTDADDLAVSVVWSGVVPDDLQTYAASKPWGVTVSVKTGARYDRATLWSGRDRILRDAIASDIKIKTTELNMDGSGITLGILTKTPLSDSQMSRLRDISGIDDISVSAVEENNHLFSTRDNDTHPFKAGIALYMAGTSSACSSGFAVLAGSAGRLLSARHCDPSGNGAVYDGSVYSGGNDQIAPGGSQVAATASLDSLLIDPTVSPATVGKSYRGGVGSSSTSHVANYSTNDVGDKICSSGAAFGEKCGNIFNDAATDVVNGVTVPVIKAMSSNNIVAGGGDSGGPIIARLASGDVQARGILVGADPNHSMHYGSDCGTAAFWLSVADERCSYWIEYVPISTILSGWGVALDTSN